METQGPFIIIDYIKSFKWISTEYLILTSFRLKDLCIRQHIQHQKKKNYW